MCANAKPTPYKVLLWNCAQTEDSEHEGWCKSRYAIYQSKHFCNSGAVPMLPLHDKECVSLATTSMYLLTPSTSYQILIWNCAQTEDSKHEGLCQSLCAVGPRNFEIQVWFLSYNLYVCAHTIADTDVKLCSNGRQWTWGLVSLKVESFIIMQAILATVIKGTWNWTIKWSQ